jgi:hypothetical protein
MIRYIDADTGAVQKQMTGSPVIAETSKRGANLNNGYRFVRDAVVIDLDPDGAEVVVLEFKAPARYDSVAAVLGPFTATKSGGGETEDPATYTFTGPLLNALLDQLFAGNLDEVTLVPEITWNGANEAGKTLAFDWVIQNNVIRGGESVPSYPVTAATERLPLVSRLTGGVLATDLDAQLLAGYADGTVIEVVTYDATLAGRVGSRWEKDNTRTETVTSIGERVIICTDGTKLFGV